MNLNCPAARFPSQVNTKGTSTSGVSGVAASALQPLGAELPIRYSVVLTGWYGVTSNETTFEVSDGTSGCAVVDLTRTCAVPFCPAAISSCSVANVLSSAT